VKRKKQKLGSRREKVTSAVPSGRFPHQRRGQEKDPLKASGRSRKGLSKEGSEHYWDEERISFARSGQGPQSGSRSKEQKKRETSAKVGEEAVARGKNEEKKSPAKKKQTGVSQEGPSRSSPRKGPLQE